MDASIVVTSFLGSDRGSYSSVTEARPPLDGGASEKITSYQGEHKNPVASHEEAGHEAGYVGLICVTSSAFLFGLIAALVKFIGMNVYVILQARGILQWIFSLVAVYAFVSAPSTVAKFFGESRQRPILFLRSGLYWGFLSLFWGALAHMPVGDATALVYCAPLFTALFGWLLLGEKVPPGCSWCLTLSLVGVGLITRPAFLFGDYGTDPTVSIAEYNSGMLYAFGSAVVGGLLPVLVRKSKECHWATVEHVADLCSSAIFTPVALAVISLRQKYGAVPDDDAPRIWDGLQDPTKLLLLLLISVLGFAGLGLQTYGYQRERAARASAMNFLEIPFSYALQYLLFGDALSPIQGLGTLLVISGGLLNLFADVQTSGKGSGSLQSTDCESCELSYGSTSTTKSSESREEKIPLVA
mmetsp:Transcript_16417/g.29654  ORF Transcript_16417/g.29654 Transcript_16417/m.29654 type:complete len:413 (+) Transcript_16417:336-1574(+)|eukprot:CAMPEP_0201605630 /NCGR_PEP_ID=MMETSP0492-20130828/5374_1 /ASSEMBLY_ACC=CAM_ASM_000837 /TAXON_ID=420259 /ORGANISM="Thalassiosira gravida, Strain GMp14c1" /LENGTH=412 /DNA_ID=CAMNT_0048069909 /DNA_START=226 /DNA_END=1464 /DNA_ORIENTATION=+